MYTYIYIYIYVLDMHICNTRAAERKAESSLRLEVETPKAATIPEVLKRTSIDNDSCKSWLTMSSGSAARLLRSQIAGADTADLSTTCSPTKLSG